MKQERFYDRRKPQDEVDGLKEALRATEERIKNGNSPEEVLEIHRQSLLKQLEAAHKRLEEERKRRGR